MNKQHLNFPIHGVPNSSGPAVSENGTGMTGKAASVVFDLMLWRRKWVIAAVTTLVVALFAGKIFLTDPTYLASAIVDVGGIRSATAEVEGLVRRDPRLRTNNHAALVRAEATARQVAKHLRLDLDPMLIHPAPPLKQITNRIIGYLFPTYGPPKSLQRDPLDGAARKLMDGLSVKTDLRSSLLTITFRAANPEAAASVANAFVAVHLRNQNIRLLNEQIEMARRSLFEVSRTLGPKHPQIISAGNRVSMLEAHLKARKQRVSLANDKELLSAGHVVPAEPVMIPASRGIGAMALLALLLGGGLGTTCAFLLELRRQTSGPTESMPKE